LRLPDVLEYAFSDYTSNKFKTAMSSLGIIIGVMAIVVMLTLGDGLYSGVSQQFGSLELDTLAVLPMGIDMQAGTLSQKPPAKLTDRDVSLIMGTPGVTGVYPEISLSGMTVTYRDENRTMGVSGIPPSTFQGAIRSRWIRAAISPNPTPTRWSWGAKWPTARSARRSGRARTSPSRTPITAGPRNTR